MTNEHFRAAMQKCAPSSLRDKAVEIPDVSGAVRDRVRVRVRVRRELGG